MKKVIKPILQVLSLLLVVIAVAIFVSSLLPYQCSSDEARLKLFYNEKEDSMEVILFGSSSVRAGFIPTKAYEEYGLTSFDYCMNHMPLPAIKYSIKETLQHQSPNLIVVDINGITYCNKETTNSKSVGFLESMKAGANKKEASLALSDSNGWEDNVSFIKYHKNIFNLPTCIKYSKYYDNFGSNQTVLKGYTTNPAAIAPFTQDQIIDHNSLTGVAKLNEYEQQSVDELLKYCDTIKDEVEILFVRFPRPTFKNFNEWEMEYINAMENRVVEAGYTYVDFTDYLDEIGIDTTTDYADDTHFNQMGAEKFTKYLCEYMLDNYTLTTRTNLPDWDKCVEIANKYYEVIKEETVKSTRKSFYEFDLAKRYNTFGIA